VLLTTCVEVPLNSSPTDEVIRREFDETFNFLNKDKLSPTLKLETTEKVPGRVGIFFVVIRVPVVVWTMLNLFSGFEFLRVIEVEEGKEEDAESEEMDISEGSPF
jgi:hypothetical protein